VILGAEGGVIAVSSGNRSIDTLCCGEGGSRAESGVGCGNRCGTFYADSQSHDL
jgi:hypothetical protein